MYKAISPRQWQAPGLGKISAALVGMAALLAQPAHATQLVPQNLRQMIAASDVIVTGEVSKVVDGVQDGVPFTEVTLKVKGSIKRELAENSLYSFRQYGLLKPRKLPDGRYLLPAKIEGMPNWKVGEKVTTFLNKPGKQTGLTTPVGLAQGKLTVGGTQMSNSFNNHGLFKGVTVEPRMLDANESAMLAKEGGPVEAGVLLQLVKRAVNENWIDKGVMR